MKAAVATRAAVYALLACGWALAAWALAGSVVPDDLSLPRVNVDATFGGDLVSRAERYERFLYVDWALAQIAALATLWVYAKRGTRFIRESAAGPIGTGMFLGMVGLAIVWLTQLPFSVAALWWDRRHGVSEIGYFEAIFGGWLALGGTFVAVCVALLVVMALARWLGSWWWIPGAGVFAAIAALLIFVSPYLTEGLEPVKDRRLQQTYERYEQAQGVDDIPLRIEKVSGDTSQANAYAFGMGPSSRIVLWDTLLDGRFSNREVDVVLAHELAHHSSNHIPEAIGWFALFALPGAFVLMLATRRRGGMGEPAAVPLALLVSAVFSLVVLPAQTLVSRGMEAEADWKALQTTRDPAAARGLFEEFATTSLGDPSPPTWAYLLLQTHPTLAQRVAMTDAWQARRRSRALSPLGTDPGAYTRSAITRAMASDDVAPGDGALRTWTTPSASWKTKSSSRVPSRPSACARIPDGPGRTSATSSSGRSFRAAATKRRVETSRTISPSPMRQWPRTRRRNPGARAASTMSPIETSRLRYPSRASAGTALGPSHTSPSGRTVVWMPRNGKAGSGTG
jgi:STE24 endopeptidase